MIPIDLRFTNQISSTWEITEVFSRMKKCGFFVISKSMKTSFRNPSGFCTDKLSSLLWAKVFSICKASTEWFRGILYLLDFIGVVGSPNGSRTRALALRELIGISDKCLKIPGKPLQIKLFTALPSSICFYMFIPFSICLLHVFFTVHFWD